MSTTPRNIVLLSDDTSNSSAELPKTNVWRMYEAVELTNGDQLATGARTSRKVGVPRLPA